MYEPDGDQPGEFQYFREAEALRKTHDLPAGAFDIWTNDRGLFGLIVGVGAAKSSASMMAFGLDPRFDLSQAYFMISGICGINPGVASLGSVVWADYCVDGDLAHEIDLREAPEDWETGIFPIGGFAPFESVERGRKTLFLPEEVYQLNQRLSTWALNLTKDIDLSDLDSPEMARYRSRYEGFPEAQRPPFTLKGDNLGMTRYWHGEKINAWAEKWVAFWTEGKGRFATSTMEDNGTLRALTQLAKAGIVDWDRVMLLRTGSNYTMQAPDGQSALESFRGDGGGGETMFPGYLPSLRSLQRAGSAVIAEIVNNWDQYAKNPPAR